jgi:hypothetical protein
VAAHEGALCAGRSWRFGDRDFTGPAAGLLALLAHEGGTLWGSSREVLIEDRS